MSMVFGMDGCKKGWIAVPARWENDRPLDLLDGRLIESLDQLLEDSLNPAAVALDIPIGLLEERERGGRECDRQARRRLGWPRASSVFSPPVRPILGATRYEQVRGKGLSIQAFHIMGKIAQVDVWMTPERQQLVFESHPEVAFYHLAGHPMRLNKKRRPGRRERLQALAKIYPNIDAWLDRQRFPRKDVAVDDLLDACVLTWVAYRKLRGQAVCLPTPAPRDARGLDMAIWS